MPLQPNIPKQKRSFLTKECPRCKQQQLEEDFTKPTRFSTQMEYFPFVMIALLITSNRMSLVGARSTKSVNGPISPLL